MSEYILSLDHFRFHKDGDSLVVKSANSSGFERVYNWKERYNSMETDELQGDLYNEYYIELVEEYGKFVE